jgi:hypothetical protein
MHRQDALVPELPLQRREGAATLARGQNEGLFVCFTCRWVVSARHCPPERVVLGAKLYGVDILEPGGVVS